MNDVWDDPLALEDGPREWVDADAPINYDGDDVHVEFLAYIYKTVVNKDGNLTVTLHLDRTQNQALVELLDLHHTVLQWRVTPPPLVEIDAALRQILEEAEWT